MAYNAINTGANANDGTGEPLRDAWTKANGMFAELYLMMAATIAAADYNTAMNALNSTLITLTETLNSKADAATIAGKANKTEVLSFTEGHALNPNQRMQAADNLGSYASMTFEVLPDDLELDGVLVYKLPKLPANFVIKDVRLVVDNIPPDEGADYTAALVAGVNTLAVLAGDGLPGDLFLPFSLSGPYTQIPAKTNLTLTVSAAATGSTGRLGYGLTLWIRGVWLS